MNESLGLWEQVTGESMEEEGGIEMQMRQSWASKEEDTKDNWRSQLLEISIMVNIIAPASGAQLCPQQLPGSIYE